MTCHIHHSIIKRYFLRAACTVEQCEANAGQLYWHQVYLGKRLSYSQPYESLWSVVISNYANSAATYAN